jgi:hypothetical protein
LKIHEIWVRLTTSRYTRALENENRRLRVENHALINSIIGIAGIPPLRLGAEIERERRVAIPLPAKASDEVGSGLRAAADANGSTASDEASARGSGIVLPANALRRRSWQQIGRMLEIEDARRVANRDNSDSMA